MKEVWHKNIIKFSGTEIPLETITPLDLNYKIGDLVKIGDYSYSIDRIEHEIIY